MNSTPTNDQSPMTQRHAANELDPQYARVTAPAEVREKGSQRLQVVFDSTQYLLSRATPVVYSTEQVKVTEANPAIAAHIVSATNQETPVQAVEAIPGVTDEISGDATNVDAIRAQVASLVDTTDADDARKKYGILS